MRVDRRVPFTGFTLVELLVTLAMLAVLVVVTLPPVFRAARNREVKNAAQQVLEIFDYARVQAAARNRAYQIVPTLTTGQHTGNVAGREGLQGSIVVNEGPSPACLNFQAGIQTVNGINIGWDYPSTHLVGTIPSDLPQATLCVRPDGRILRSDTMQPIQSGDALYAAGNAEFELQRYQGDNTPVGPKSVVVVSFNGAAKIITR